jgi:hypothetical protein
MEPQARMRLHAWGLRQHQGRGDSCLGSDRSIRCRAPLSRSAINVTRCGAARRGAGSQIRIGG